MVPVPEREWQPYEYSARCECGQDAPQAAWELNLAKAWANATGPRTAGGKAATAKNLEGHPTSEESRRTRFNAMKTGVFATTANYWPAKPGKYPHCEDCEHFNNGCDVAPRRGHKNPPGCLKRTELFMRFQMAFETRDPTMLTQHQATLQALAWQLTNDMFLQVIKDGSSWKTPEWHYDKEGCLHFPETIDDAGNVSKIMRIEAHPLLKIIIEFMNRNGMTLPDSGMTAKLKDEQETIKGFLEVDAKAAEGDQEFRERQTRALENLSELVQRSQQRQKRDPVLIEHAAIERESGNG